MTRARRRSAGRLLVVVLGLLATLAVAGPAAAHVGGGQAGSDFDGRIQSVSPDLPGVRVRVLQFGDQLEVVNRTATELEVPGYSAEPYLRIGSDGVWRNVHSPATYLNLAVNAAVALPPAADVAAAPEWQQVSTQPTYVWHDHRTHWMSAGQLPPVVAADPTTSHTVIRWTVPMTYGGAPVTVAGVLTWSPPPPGWLVWPVYVLLLVATAAAGWVARTPLPLAVALGVGAVALLWHGVATPEPAASVSSHAGALASALLPGLLVLLVAVVGVRAARRRRGVLTGLMAVVAGWLLLMEGLPDVDVLWSANVLAAGPQLAARAAVAVLVAVGLGLVIGGAGAVRRFRDQDAARPPAGGSPSSARSANSTAPAAG